MPTFTNLFSFASNPGGNATGATPFNLNGQAIDAQGNIFGTTQNGGTNDTGAVYELVKGGSGTYTATTLFSFAADASGNATGSNPAAAVIADAQGNLYGTTQNGGTDDTGTVYELVKGGNGSYTERVLFSFAARGAGINATGATPAAGLMTDAQGNLYGTTANGGANGTGTVYELMKGANGAYTNRTLFSFDANTGINATGANPSAGVIADVQGNLYGTAPNGGANGTGTVYELIKDANGAYTNRTLFSFDSTGSAPSSGLIADAQGNLFGTTHYGNTNNTGTVYELVKGANGAYTKTTLFSFDAYGGNVTGAAPISGVIADAQGNLFGAASTGGTASAGTVYELVKGANGTYTETTLFALGAPSASATGSFPFGGLTADAQGNLYGSALQGGTNNTGTVFRLSDSGFVVPSLPAASGLGGGSSGPSTTPSPGPDVLSGTGGADTIAAGAGDDTINGGGGNSLLLGNQGRDVITAGDGANTVVGGMDDDRITVGNGANLLYGDEGSDTIAAGDGNNTIVGGTGNATLDANDGADSITVGSGNDLVLGNGGNDTINVGGGTDTALGGMGNDLIVTTGSGIDLLFGGEGADTIQAGNGDNTIVGGSGNSASDSLDGADFITSGSGTDLILGNGGDDTVAAGGGADTVSGGFGRDIILGNQGNDLLLGNQGDDTLYGGQGGDTLYGGMGNDVLYGNEGDDVLYGNEGLNTFVFAPGDTDFKSGVSTGDTVMDFVTGTSRIDFASGPAGSATNFGTGSTTVQDFASAQAVAQGLIDGGDAYAFVSNGTDGYLFTTGGTGTAITDAVKLAGAGTASAATYTDIAHGSLA